MPTQYITTNVRLPKSLHKALKRRAVEEEVSFAELIREALAECFMHPDSNERGKTGIMSGSNKITTFTNLAKLAGPLGGDLSNNIDAIVYGEHRD